MAFRINAELEAGMDKDRLQPFRWRWLTFFPNPFKQEDACLHSRCMAICLNHSTESYPLKWLIP